jgi:hypothetical protein
MPPLIIALALGGLLVVSLPASADPIRIIGGNLNFDDGDPPSFGFELAGAPFRLGGAIFGVMPGNESMLSIPLNSAVGCLFIAPCFSGANLTLGVTILGRGAAIVGPVDDPDSPQTMPAEAMFAFTTPDVPLVGQAVNVFLIESPFQVTGWLRAFADETFSRVVFETTLFGHGTATAALGQGEPYNAIGPYAWEESIYRFAAADPIPEPGTLALLATGLASLCAAHRRRARGGRQRA